MEVAKKNGLRFLEFWNIKQVEEWISKYGKFKRFNKSMLNPNF